MDADRHLMVRTDSNGRESLFECGTEDCGRRLIFDHVEGRLIVLDDGDLSTLHYGSSGPVVLSARVDAYDRR